MLRLPHTNASFGNSEKKAMQKKSKIILLIVTMLLLVLTVCLQWFLEQRINENSASVFRGILIWSAVSGIIGGTVVLVHLKSIDQKNASLILILSHIPVLSYLIVIAAILLNL